jgi:hypothetical protein
MNCADNSGAKNLYTIACFGIKGHLSKLPSASIGDMILCSVKKGSPKLRKKGKKYLNKHTYIFYKNKKKIKYFKQSLLDKEDPGEEEMVYSFILKVKFFNKKYIYIYTLN